MSFNDNEYTNDIYYKYPCPPTGNPTARDSRGRTACHIAAMNNELHLIHSTWYHNADIQDDIGWTVAMTAANYGLIDKLL